MTASLDDQLRHFAFQIDTDKVSPQQLEELWDLQHASTKLAGRLVVRHVRGDGSPLDPDGSCWWLQHGAGRVFIGPNDAELCDAVTTFLIQYRRCFKGIWYGPLDMDPPADVGHAAVTVATAAVPARSGGESA